MGNHLFTECNLPFHIDTPGVAWRKLILQKTEYMLKLIFYCRMNRKKFNDKLFKTYKYYDWHLLYIIQIRN